MFADLAQAKLIPFEIAACPKRDLQRALRRPAAGFLWPRLLGSSLVVVHRGRFAIPRRRLRLRCTGRFPLCIRFGPGLRCCRRFGGCGFFGLRSEQVPLYLNRHLLFLFVLNIAGISRAGFS